MTSTAQARYPERKTEPLLSAAQLGEWLGVSRATIGRLMRSGAIAPIYLDSRPRFDPEEIRQFIAARRRGHDADSLEPGERPPRTDTPLVPEMREPGFDRAQGSRGDDDGKPS
jgi:predicted DNA-binding transcriptional regulator AlpA